MEIKKYCLEISNNYSSKSFQRKSKEDNMYDAIVEKTKEYKDIKFSQRVYNIINDINIVLCKTCNKPVLFNCFSKGYYDFCSTYCVSINKEEQKKKKNTILKKYGVENISQSEEIKIIYLIFYVLFDFFFP